MQLVKPVKRKTFKIRPSGRSSDFVAPSFGYGCLLECSYCYMKRHKPRGLDYATNINQILDEINHHSIFAVVDKPNQTDPDYITYDISCNEDFAFHSKFYDWRKIFDFFVESDKAKATLATKIVPDEFLHYNPHRKVRIRFSLMPQKIADLLEPNTASIIERIQAIDKFIEAGYDVHVNFSPVVYYKRWLEDYEELFNLLDVYVKNKKSVLAEVIFLTHNVNKHYKNISDNRMEEYLLWNPLLQEQKKSQYGGLNIRYKQYYKKQMIDKFKTLHNAVVPWNTIRYIF